MNSSFWGLLFCVFFLRLSAFAAAPGPNAIIEGKDLQTGAHVQYSAQKKKAVVLIFLSTACPNSLAHTEEIKKLANENPAFLFLGVHSNADESATFAQTYFKNLNLPFEVLQDDKAVLADKFKALKTPHVAVLSAAGEVLYQGGVTDSAKPENARSFYLQDALNDIKNERPVKTPEGRTLGCIISRAKETKGVW